MSKRARPVVIVLHGPSGVGKDTVIAELTRLTGIKRAITSTSRPPRPNERDGVDYYFLSREDFEAKVERGDFLEHAEVYGDLKGLERAELERLLAEGHDVIIRTDVQGARTFRRILPGAVFILLEAEDSDAYGNRLARRDTESDESLRRRLAEVEAELADRGNNDYVITNRHGEARAAAEEIAAVIERERANPARPPVRLPSK
ncbi:MAG: guanylate kinase [Dehalococcoidia bacterium]